jgi:hypothetical protein
MGTNQLRSGCTTGVAIAFKVKVPFKDITPANVKASNLPVPSAREYSKSITVLPVAV